jgi:hypothetical protein
LKGGFIVNPAIGSRLNSKIGSIKLVKKGRPRLLLMDNHGSHLTFEFIDFCTQKNISSFMKGE